MSVTSSLSLLFGRLIRYGGGRLPGPGACSVRARYSEVSMIDRRGRASWGTERSATGGSAVFSGRTYATSVPRDVRGGGTAVLTMLPEASTARGRREPVPAAGPER